MGIEIWRETAKIFLLFLPKFILIRQGVRYGTQARKCTFCQHSGLIRL